MENTQAKSLSEQRLVSLSDVANLAHFRIQQDFKDIDPVIGISRNMRKNGVPADIMTIDCLKSGKRIIVVLHDQDPEQVSYQFSYKDQDPDGEFISLANAELSEAVFYEWIKTYFTPANE